MGNAEKEEESSEKEREKGQAADVSRVSWQSVSIYKLESSITLLVYTWDEWADVHLSRCISVQVCAYVCLCSVFVLCVCVCVCVRVSMLVCLCVCVRIRSCVLQQTLSHTMVRYLTLSDTSMKFSSRSANQTMVGHDTSKFSCFKRIFSILRTWPGCTAINDGYTHKGKINEQKQAFIFIITLLINLIDVIYEKLSVKHASLNDRYDHMKLH